MIKSVIKSRGLYVIFMILFVMYVMQQVGYTSPHIQDHGDICPGTVVSKLASPDPASVVSECGSNGGNHNFK